MLTVSLAPQRIALDALNGDLHRLDPAVAIEPQLVDADDAVVPIAVTKRPAMVDDVPPR